MASYKEHSLYALSRFDSVVYKSEVRQLTDTNFEVTYFDIISKQNKSHTYCCKQVISFNSEHKIQLIRHEEIPAEYAKLMQFYKDVGLA